MDKKNVFIIILCAALILSFIFRPSNKINTHEDEINALKLDNQRILKNNDSLLAINNTLSVEIKDLVNDINRIKNSLGQTKDKINKLQNDKDKVSSYVNTLNADGVANELTKYLNRR